jgi:hypothetical protein
MTLEALFDEVRDHLQNQNQHVPYKRVVTTIMRSGSVVDENGQRIDKLSDGRPVGPFPAENQVVRQCAMLLKSSLQEGQQGS